MLGDVNVGKSNIIRRILGQEFEELEATIGVEFGYYDVNDIDPELVKLAKAYPVLWSGDICP